ncbi:uncharacterized protein PITG_06178 [Phytophthora infestans T30-4]|uniref:Uncharacterized protein n=1 Tax=Phytophthora infestans (strain T30-4) TaxID=403677 RepID=D0N495_PHYIT|nr:uncharacterized protein PITG_06178 [Phytophthora infestans T30-4]EEY69703.1 conserved hypothetical protein [Phytophthora infestans T30-4]|eukprot:XP_002998350.1 conserved hypothetical protein [Phytophthora infestans T30-4]
MATPGPKEATPSDTQQGEEIPVEGTTEEAITIVDTSKTAVETMESEAANMEQVTETTIKEQTVEEQTEEFEAVSAEVVEEIAKSIAAHDAAVEIDYSVAATLGSSVDGESVKTEDFAGEEAFIEESSKKAEVDLAALAAADETAELEREEHVGTSVETTETKDTSEMKDDMQGTANASSEISDADVNATIDTGSEMDFSVAATVGSSVDADSVFSLDEMRDSTNEDETTSSVNSNEVTSSEVAAESTELHISHTLETDEPESEKTPPKSVISDNPEAHRTDSAAKLAHQVPSPVHSIVHHLEEHEQVAPTTHRTASAAKLDVSGSSPVKQVPRNDPNRPRNRPRRAR